MPGVFLFICIEYNTYHMKNSYVYIIAIFILVVAFFVDFYVFQNSTQGEHTNGDLFKTTQRETQNIAEQWIMEKSPTYLFDGANLVFVREEKGSCDSCTAFVFSFESRHGGYGNRDGLILTQVITPHAIAVETKNGDVVRAITDKKYNELTGALAE